MSRKHVVEKSKNGNQKEKEKFTTDCQSNPLKHLRKVYPVVHHRDNSILSLSSLSLTLSQNSSGSSTDSSLSTMEQNISSALHLIASVKKSEAPLVNIFHQPNLSPILSDGLRRCNWITKNSYEVYVKFHDECWGVPVYDDRQLFELLSLCGMLMDFNWTEILRRKLQFRAAFAGFEPHIVAKMGEKEIMEIASNKEVMLAESRVRCIVDNAISILKIAKECGSFSGYMWGAVNYKPTINRCRHPRNVPLRTPKAEAISKDLVKHGFRLVGPVIVYSFMQAAGMSNDHLVGCFRFKECVSLAERPWRHV